MTLSAFGAGLVVDHPVVDFVFMDESETANLVDFLTLIGNADFEKLILLGDPFQRIYRDPRANGATFKELEMGLLQYLEHNHWPRSQMYLNRRRPPRINAVVSPVFYDGKIQDAPCTLDPLNHSKTQTYLDFFLNLFPGCKSNYPIRYISLQGKPEVQDSLTKSWCNLDDASVIINIIENGVLPGCFKPTKTPLLVHYKSQQKS